MLTNDEHRILRAVFTLYLDACDEHGLLQESDRARARSILKKILESQSPAQGDASDRMAITADVAKETICALEDVIGDQIGLSSPPYDVAKLKKAIAALTRLANPVAGFGVGNGAPGPFIVSAAAAGSGAMIAYPTNPVACERIVEHVSGMQPPSSLPTLPPATQITDEQIRQLQSEAYENDRYEVYRLCRIARGEVKSDVSRESARARCAQLIESKGQR